MRRALIAGNWKMHLPRDAARKLVSRLLPLVGDAPAEVVLAPAFPCLGDVGALLAGTPVRLAAQNVHWEDSGAFTGEVAAPMLAAAGVGLVIVGHSERRALFGETDEQVALKTAAVLRHGMIPIVCVGETEPQRDAGRTLEVVGGQLDAALTPVASDEAARELVVAYEPIWAIGTGRVATTDQVAEVHAMVRERLARLLGNAGDGVRVLYGGSVKPGNAAELLALDDVDGALVGGASLDAEGFAAIVAAARR